MTIKIDSFTTAQLAANAGKGATSGLARALAQLQKRVGQMQGDIAQINAKLIQIENDIVDLDTRITQNESDIADHEARIIILEA